MQAPKLASLSIAAFVLIGCGPDAPSSVAQSSDPPSSDAPSSDAPSASAQPGLEWGPVAAFQSPLQMEARNEGVLRITDLCTFLERGEERAFLAWPADRTRWNPGEASITFRTRSGHDVTLRDGDEIVLGGGGSSRAEGGDTGFEWAARHVWVSPPDPSCLLDVRWEVSEVEP